VTRSKLAQELLGSTSLTPVGEADPLKADFRNFLYVIWKHLGLPDPTWVQYDIASFLQHGPRRLIVEAFRGVGKSWVTAAFICWLWYRDAQTRVMAVSANAPKAIELASFVLRLLNEVPILQHLAPRMDGRRSVQAFDVALAKPDIAPSLKSLGISGQLTGSRSDVIVADDIEIPTNSDTQAKRDKILESVKEFDAVLKPGGRIVYLGTPQTEQSVYNTLPDRGYVVRIWPARFPADLNRYGLKLAPAIRKKLVDNSSLVRDPTDPARFSDADLTERELSYGRSGFQLQFQLDTSLTDADKFPLKLADLIVHPLDPFRAPVDFMWAGSKEMVVPDLPALGMAGDRFHRPMWWSPDSAPYESAVMFVDPSGRGRDETAYAVVKLLHGRLFLTAWGGFIGGYTNETLKSLIQIAKKHDVRLIKCEPNFGGGMFTKLLQSMVASLAIHDCGVEDADWSKAMKEQRIIDTLEPVMNQHRLVVCPSVIEADYASVKRYDGDRAPYYRGFYQMTRMVRAKGALAQDDRLDALAGAVTHFMDSVARDTLKAVTDRKEALLDAELQRFLQHTLGKSLGPQREFSSGALRRTGKGR
jgi:hypothetical protein